MAARAGSVRWALIGWGALALLAGIVHAGEPRSRTFRFTYEATVTGLAHGQNGPRLAAGPVEQRRPGRPHRLPGNPGRGRHPPRAQVQQPHAPCGGAGGAGRDGEAEAGLPRHPVRGASRPRRPRRRRRRGRQALSCNRMPRCRSAASRSTCWTARNCPTTSSPRPASSTTWSTATCATARKGTGWGRGRRRLGLRQQLRQLHRLPQPVHLPGPVAEDPGQVRDRLPAAARSAARARSPATTAGPSSSPRARAGCRWTSPRRTRTRR